MAQPPYTQAPPPGYYAAPEKPKGGGLAVTSLVLGIVALVFSWIPIVNIFAIVLGIIGLIFGIVGIFKSRRTMSIIGAVLSLLAIIISIAISGAFASAVDDAVDDASASASAGATGASSAPDASDDPLSDGGWTAGDVRLDASGPLPSLTARVMNNEADSRSGLFTITIFDAAGAPIGDASGAANDVESGSAATVTFLLTDSDALAGDPATYTYEFQDNGSY